MSRPRLLDLFCGAGGAAMGYHRAGFDVVGVDIKPQPHYPFEFHQMDALDVLEYVTTPSASGDKADLWGWTTRPFAAIHASPPCQAYSVTKSLRKRTHPDLVGPTRDLLVQSGLPWIMENVPGAPLRNAIVLCGTMFPELRVYRHRLFECDPPIYFPPLGCNHSFSMPASKGQYHTLDTQDFISAVGHNFSAASGRIALGIDWMTRDEMAQAIPPAYTEWIGKQLLASLELAA